MLEIVNITQNTSTNIQFKQFSGEAPTQLTLRPGDKYVLANALMKLYSTGVKQNVAAMVAKAIIAVNNSADVHVYPDKDHIPDYDKGCVQGPGPVLALACTPVILPIGGTTPPTLQKDMPDCNPYCISISNKSSTSDGLHWDDEVTGLEMAIAAFNILRDTYDAHAVSLAYHPVAGVRMVGIPPTNLENIHPRRLLYRIQTVNPRRRQIAQHRHNITVRMEYHLQSPTLTGRANLFHFLKEPHLPEHLFTEHRPVLIRNIGVYHDQRTHLNLRRRLHVIQRVPPIS